MSKLWTLMVLTAAMAVPAAAQKPDLSGTWKLNFTKSFLGADHPNKDYEMTKIILQEAGMIKQTDVAVHVSMMNIPLPDSRATGELVAEVRNMK